ncbi:MAG: MBL fold metallo-hydrolase [Gammaproteobacteria bacterium]|nr:MAG: MBL fold metallo-hydrolase [Gammaproteobacteria bacterium]
MKRKLTSLPILLAVTMLSACDSGDLSETNMPQNKPAQATVQPPAPMQEQEQVLAPSASQDTAPPLTGEALYTSDKAPDSMLYDKPKQVIDGVWSAIGSFAPARYENSGHNNNLSFIVTSDGVLVVNAGANYLLAKALHTEIKKITDQPVKFVVLENAQGHAMLGSNYWQEQGATVIAHEDAVQEIKDTSFAVFEEMKRVMKEKAEGTKVTLPDESFKHNKVIEMGGVRFELIHLGPTHSPGDIVVWLPQKRLVVSGDMAFHQRMLPLFEYTDTAAWIKTWDKFAALGAEYVIPGHGEATNMAKVTRYTRDYLVYLRTKVAELIENGGTLQDAYNIDQSAYINLPTAEFLAKRNAGQVFQSMEFE